jgi:membrane-associated phospholipid phosphatase
MEQSINLILTLQNLSQWLISIMRAFTFMGYEEFYLLVIPAIYWCFDSSLGARLTIMLVATSSINETLKMVFHSPRPFWISSQVDPMSPDTNFGIPSGHAQNAVSIWGVLAAALKRRWAWVIYIAVAVLIGLSRLFTGMHFPVDILIGWIIGIILLIIFLGLDQPVTQWVKQQTTRGKTTLIIGISMVILLFGNLAIWNLNGWILPAEWIDTARLSGGAIPEPISRNPITSTAGVFLGLGVGLVLLGQHGGFNPKGTLWKRSLRYLLGIIGTLAIWAGLKAVFPSGEEFVPQALRYLRYAALGIWVAVGAPLLFLKLNLAQPAPQE